MRRFTFARLAAILLPLTHDVVAAPDQTPGLSVTFNAGGKAAGQFEAIWQCLHSLN